MFKSGLSDFNRVFEEVVPTTEAARSHRGGPARRPKCATAGINLTYLRPAAGEKLIARASAQAATSRTAVTQVEICAVKDGQEYVCTVGTGNITAINR